MEQQLERVSAEAESNRAASNILSDLINKGEAQMNEHGQVEVVRQDIAEQVLN